MGRLSVTDKYFMIAEGINVERYSCSELYNKLSKMNEFERIMLIKKINDAYEYEAVNYNLMKQQYEKPNNICNNTNSTSDTKENNNDAFSKEYMKAYMSMLSGAM